MVPKVTCPVCNMTISKSNWSKHERRHKEHPETFKTGKYALSHDGLTCQFCDKLCKNRNSLCNHERLCKKNPDRQLPAGGVKNIPNFNQKGREAWNKGLTKETDPRVFQFSLLLKELYKEGKILNFDNPMNNVDSVEKLRNSMLNVYSNVTTKVSGRSKQGWYKGFYCRSSWELAYLIFCIDHKISIEPCRKSFKYMYDGKEHSYFPDFYHPENCCYVEIKGYEDEKVKYKIEQFPENEKLIVLRKDDLADIFSYVETKYGEDYTELYEIECAEVPKW